MGNRIERQLDEMVSAICATFSRRRTAKGHFKYEFSGPAGTFCAVNSGTPSDWRSVKNFTAQVKQAVRSAGLAV